MTLVEVFIKKEICFCILKCYFSQSLLQILISQTCLFTSWQLQGCSELSIQTDFSPPKRLFAEHFRVLLLKIQNFKNIFKRRNIQLFMFRRPKLQLSNYGLLKKGRCFRLKNNKEYFVFLGALQGRNLWGSRSGGGQGTGPGLPTQGRSPSPPRHPPPQGCWVGASPSSSCCRQHAAGGALFERALASPDVLASSPDVLDLPRKYSSSHIKWGRKEKKGIALC